MNSIHSIVPMNEVGVEERVNEFDIRKEFTIEQGIGYCSLSGLAKMSGVAQTTLYNATRGTGLLVTIARASDFSDGLNTLPDCLKPFAGGDWIHFSDDSKSTIWVADVLAAAIVEYYAFESKTITATARKTFRAFAAVGMRVWIHGLLGETVESTIERMSPMDKMRQHLKRLRENLIDFGVSGSEVSDLLKRETNKVIDREALRLEGKGLISVPERLEQLGYYDLEDGVVSGIGQTVACQARRRYPDAEPLKLISSGPRVYRIEDYEWIDEIIHRKIAQRGEVQRLI